MTETFAILHQVEKDGWSITARHAGWQLRHPRLDESAYVSITPSWLCLMTPVSRGDGNARVTGLDSPVALYRPLLERNELIYMAKYSLDSDGTLLLMVEVPLHTVSQSMLRMTLEALTREKHEISNLRSELEGSSSEDEIVKLRQTINSTVPIIPKETVQRYMQSLETSGWYTKGVETKSQGLTWFLVYGGIHKFEVYFMLTRNWAYFQVPVLVDPVAPVLATGDAQLCTYLMEYLLRLNRECFMAKFGLDAKGQVLLLLEMPAELLTLRLLQLMARTIATYLNRYGQEIQIMASLQNDPKLIELLHAAV